MSMSLDFILSVMENYWRVLSYDLIYVLKEYFDK